MDSTETTINPITDKILNAAIEVHRSLGPGLLESAYEECMCHELSLQNIVFVRQFPLPLKYKEVSLDCAYRIDILVANTVVVEIKAVELLLPIHEAQLLTCLKLGKWPAGLLSCFQKSAFESRIQESEFRSQKRNC